jgi:hypothetical protein
MSIAAPKVDPESFKDLFSLVSSHDWLKCYEDSLIELWNLCETREQRSLLSELISRFTVLSLPDLSKIVTTIKEKTEDWGVTVNQTLFIPTTDGESVDGSISGLQFMKNKFPLADGWEERHFCTTLARGAHRVKNNFDVIIFDDFIGTGKTLIRKVNWFRKIVEERGIHLATLRICSFAAMEFGIINVQTETDTEIFSPIRLKKGISDYNSEVDGIYKKNLMVQLEEKLSKHFKGLHLAQHSLGYKGTEALFNVQDSNCPNNVFPIFWWPLLEDESYRKTLFARSR